MTFMENAARIDLEVIYVSTSLSETNKASKGILQYLYKAYALG